MTRQHANILRGFAGWTLFVWIVQLRNIWHGHRSGGFKFVHTVLGVVSVSLALMAIWVVAQNRGRTAPKVQTTPPK